jgi:hypothetical protein
MWRSKWVEKRRFFAEAPEVLRHAERIQWMPWWVSASYSVGFVVLGA